jgi:uncharacterized membrane protein
MAQVSPTPLLFPEVRGGLPLLAPFSWLSRGLADLRHAPGPSLFHGLCFTVLGWLLLAAFRQAIEFITAATAGFLLLGPFLALGLYELSRRREQKLDCSLAAAVAVWRASAGSIGTYSLLLIVLYLVWARASLAVFAIFYANDIPTTVAFLHQVRHLDNLDFLLAYLMVGVFFAGLVFACSVIAIPLMLDRGLDAGTAMATSVFAVIRNLPAMLVWAALIVALLTIGMGTAYVGVIIAMPILGHATWHAYRDLVG